MQQAGKHIEVEILVADSWTDAEAADKMQKETGVGLRGRLDPAVQSVAP